MGTFAADGSGLLDTQDTPFRRVEELRVLDDRQGGRVNGRIVCASICRPPRTPVRFISMHPAGLTPPTGLVDLCGTLCDAALVGRPARFRSDPAGA